MADKMQLTIKQKLISLIIVINIVISGLLAWSVHNVTYQQYLKSFLQYKLNFARSVAQMIDGDQHKKFNATKWRNDQEYKKLSQKLSKVKTEEKYITYLYTLAIDSAKNQFYYVLDADVAENNIVWLEARDFMIEVHIDETKIWFVDQNKEIGTSITNKINGKEVTFTTKKTETGGIIKIGEFKLAEIISQNPLKVKVSDGVLDTSCRFLESRISEESRSDKGVFSLSFKNEPVSDPGTPMLDNPITEAHLHTIFKSGKAYVDSASLSNNYGSYISAYGIIKDGNGNKIGLLCADIMDDEIKKFKSSITRTAFLFTFISAILTFLSLFFILNHLVIKRIKKLDQGIKELSLEKFETRIEINSSDEFGHLAKGLNQMALNLHTFYSQLKDEIAISKSLHDNIFIPFFKTDCLGTITFINSGALRYTTLTESEIIGKVKATRILTEEDIVNKALAGQHFINYETEITDKAGYLVPVIFNTGSILNSHGVNMGTFFMFTDLREVRHLKIINEQLILSNETIKTQMETILHQKKELELVNRELEDLSVAASETTNAIAIFNLDGNYEWVNRAFKELYGFDPKVRDGLLWFNLENPAFNATIEKAIENFKLSKAPLIHLHSVSSSLGADLWIQRTITPLFDKENNLNKIIAVDTDISKLKFAEAQILLQNREIKNQKQELLIKNTKIVNSINCALSLQSATLPNENEMDEWFNGHFVFYKPRDIVSGDFYFYAKQEDYIYIAAADCTGHGVPGAFLSILGITLLTEIIQNQSINPCSSAGNSCKLCTGHNYCPARILNELREKFKKALNQTKQSADNLDGMDMALCILDTKKYQLQFAGADQSIFVVRNQQIIEYPGDIMPVGVFFIEHAFSRTIIDLQKSDQVYLFSDGFYSQFGGEKGRKFQARNFRDLLLTISSKPMYEQKALLQATYDEWRGEYSQVDDILVMGFKV
jgi:PAS domain S-box-containing protein